MFFYLAFIASGALGGLIALTRILPGLANSSKAAALPETLEGLAIDVGAVLLFTFLYTRENKAKEAQLAKLSREESLSKLKLRLNEKKIISVSDLRGEARLVILAGPASFLADCFKRSKPFTDALIERGVLVVPFSVDGSAPTFEFDDEELVEEKKKRLWQLTPTLTNEWAK